MDWIYCLHAEGQGLILASHGSPKKMPGMLRIVSSDKFKDKKYADNWNYSVCM